MYPPPRDWDCIAPEDEEEERKKFTGRLRKLFKENALKVIDGFKYVCVYYCRTCYKAVGKDSFSPIFVKYRSE
jgi:hypothetical protein